MFAYLSIRNRGRIRVTFRCWRILIGHFESVLTLSILLLPFSRGNTPTIRAEAAHDVARICKFCLLMGQMADTNSKNMSFQLSFYPCNFCIK